MAIGDVVGILNLVVSAIIAGCALYLTFAALQHTAKPLVEVELRSASNVQCDSKQTFVFGFANKGHWYAKPTAINMRVYCNFSPVFRLGSIHYGSTQSASNTDVKPGKRNMEYLKATGMVLAHGEEEEVHVVAQTPQAPGEYLTRVVAIPENGNAIIKEFKIQCMT